MGDFTREEILDAIGTAVVFGLPAIIALAYLVR